MGLGEWFRDNVELRQGVMSPSLLTMHMDGVVREVNSGVYGRVG